MSFNHVNGYRYQNYLQILLSNPCSKSSLVFVFSQYTFGKAHSKPEISLVEAANVEISSGRNICRFIIASQVMKSKFLLIQLRELHG